jgi:tetratricopeptide (TPR) repeat protein
MQFLSLLLFLSTLQISPSPNSPENEQAWFAKARQYYQEQEWVKAQEAAAHVLQINPRLAAAEILLGLIATAQHQFQIAETHFERAVSLQPRDDLAQSYLANNYLQQRHLDKARAAFTKTLQLNPKNQSACYNLGLIALMQQKPDEALIQFERVHRANASDVPALIGMLESQLLLKRGSEAKQSVATLSSILRPEDPMLFQVATMLALHEDYQSAIPLMEQARRTFPNSYDVSFNLALAYFHAGHFDRASEILRPLVNQGKKAEAYDLLGVIQERLGHPAQARELLQQAVALDSGSEDFHFNYANHVLQFETSQAAIEIFRSEVERFPRSWRMLLGLGSAYYLSGKYGETAQALLQAIQLKPDSKLAYFLLGKVYESAESSQGSIEEAFRVYCHRAPDDPWAYYHYGTILYLLAQSGKSPDLQKATFILKKALAQNSKFAEAHFQLGLIAQSEEQWEEGIRHLEDAIRLDPKMAAAHYRLGLAYQRFGEREKATAEFELFEKLKSENQAEQDKQTVLEYLAEQGR